jgi:hypothetical protein
MATGVDCTERKTQYFASDSCYTLVVVPEFIPLSPKAKNNIAAKEAAAHTRLHAEIVKFWRMWKAGDAQCGTVYGLAFQNFALALLDAVAREVTDAGWPDPPSANNRERSRC